MEGSQLKHALAPVIAISDQVHEADLAIRNYTMQLEMKNIDEAAACAALFKQAYYAARAAYIEKLMSEFPGRKRYDCEYEADELLEKLHAKFKAAVKK